MNNDTYAVEMFTAASRLVYRNNGGSDTVLQTLSPNTWYTIKLVANPVTDKVDYYVNNELKASGIGFRNADNIEFSGGWGGIGTIYVDQVKLTN
ncbi:hypothetical protein [Paenibacillus swuensis]|uniref:hypothetical protein n=1 Tax=Paenibacillus swuensis TaxID=1178515 RepID=UPI001E53D02D|nr:hypothetical protein [Paenibacillus swuensis]